MIDFLLAGPMGRDELRAQASTAQVQAICSCGCPSVFLVVDDRAPRAGADGWLPITAVQRKSRGGTEVTLHVVDGRLVELEIWGGEYGVRPRLDIAKLEYADLAPQ